MNFQDGGALKKRSHASFLNQCLVLTRRSFVNMYRDLGYYWLRLAIYVALTVALGTIFHNVGYSNSSIKVRNTHRDSYSSNREQDIVSSFKAMQHENLNLIFVVFNYFVFFCFRIEVQCSCM